MENNTNLPEENNNNVKVYTSDDEIPVTRRQIPAEEQPEAIPPTDAKSTEKPQRNLRAKRDIKEDNDKTRVDLPTGEITAPRKRRVRQEEPMYQDEPPVLEEDEPMSKSIFTMLGKGLIYFVFVIAVSVILAYYIITIGNDIFAFIKDTHEVKIVVDADDDIGDIAKKLQKEGVVKYPLVFKLYNSFKNRDSEEKQEFVPDTYVFTADLNYDELIAKFEKSAPVRTVVTITFTEGLTADQMINIFLENGIGTREGFEMALKKASTYDMNYQFLNDLKELEKEGFRDGRKYALEGYLYPDTYQFYTDTSEIDAVSKLLKTFNVRFEKEYYARCEELGMSVDDVVNIAAIVQKETKFSSEYPIVSSLYHNRLANPSSFPRLQCDSTYLYSFPERRESLTLDEMKQSTDPYSTYSHDGLPPSAICSPSLDAIIAALYPNGADSSGNNHTYYYMVARPDGYHYFAKTEAEHINNIARAEAEKGE